MCGMLLYQGALSAAVLVSNVPFSQAMLDAVAAEKVRVKRVAPDREIRTLTFDWSPAADPTKSAAPPPSAPPAMNAGPSGASEAMRLGNEAAARGDLAEALRSFNEAVRLDPRHAQSWANRSFVLSRMRRFEEALASAEEAIRVDPTLVQGWTNATSALANLNRFEEVVRRATHALSMAPGHASLHLNLATAADKTGRWALAYEHYERFVTLAPPTMAPQIEHARKRMAILHPDAPLRRR